MVTNKNPTMANFMASKSNNTDDKIAIVLSI